MRCWRTRWSLAAALLLGLMSGRDAAGQDAQCPTGEVLRGDLGISGLECNCSYSFSGDERYWRFRSEPRILSVRGSGPSDRLLRRDDVIIGMDGYLITTDEAGRRYANVRPGQEVTFDVRRDGRLTRIQLVAGSTCDALPVMGEPPPPPVDAEPPSPTAERATVPVPPAAALAALEAYQRAQRVRSSGWLGFGIRCSDCALETGDSAAVWEFSEPPEIFSVEPGGPAAEAGLKNGDLLLEIDGVSIVAPEGGRRFGAVKPGQKVRLTYRRGGSTSSVSLSVQSRPTIRRLGLDTALTVRSLTVGGPPAPAAPDPDVLRFAGNIGDVDVEIRGPDMVVVSVIGAGDEMVIVAGTTRIRLRKVKE